MKNRQYESMTRVPLTYWTVRVWCKSHEWMKPGPDARVVTAVLKAAVKAPSTMTQPAEIAIALEEFDKVAAYEITDLNGNGAVVTTER